MIYNIKAQEFIFLAPVFLQLLFFVLFITKHSLY